MVRSIGELSLGVFAVAAMGLAMACGSDEVGKPTGLPIGQVPTSAGQVSPAAQSATNTPPVIERVVLRPETPRPGERLSAVVEAFDAEGNAMGFRFVWTVDGDQIENPGAELMLRDVRKGSTVSVEVVASDSHDVSDPYEVSVTIANRPPVLQGVVLEPLGEVTAAHDVTAVPRSYDPDGDEVTYEYKWKINGSGSYGEGPVLFAKEFKRGDEIVLVVIADDGEDKSEPLVSAAITVANAKPQITSAPAGFGGDRFIYVVRVDDPDKDRRMRFHLEQGPDGMSIDNLGGKITWTPGSDQEGAHTVEVMVSDSNGGEAKQLFELDLSFKAEDVPASPQE